MCVFFLSYSHPSSSTVSVVFDINASLSDVAPMPPILLTVGVIRRENSELLMVVFCVSSFVLTSQIQSNKCCV